MKKYKIDKNIPLPPVHKLTVLYPLETMEVGDSFFVPDKKANHLNVHYQGKRLNRMFVKRSIDGGTRVWRVT